LSSTPPISTIRTITFLTELIEHTKTTTYDVGNPDPGLGQAQHVAGLSRLTNVYVINGHVYQLSYSLVSVLVLFG